MTERLTPVKLTGAPDGTRLPKSIMVPIAYPAYTVVIKQTATSHFVFLRFELEGATVNRDGDETLIYRFLRAESHCDECLAEYKEAVGL